MRTICTIINTRRTIDEVFQSSLDENNLVSLHLHHHFRGKWEDHCLFKPKWVSICFGRCSKISNLAQSEFFLQGLHLGRVELKCCLILKWREQKCTQVRLVIRWGFIFVTLASMILTNRYDQSHDHLFIPRKICTSTLLLRAGKNSIGQPSRHNMDREISETPLIFTYDLH